MYISHIHVYGYGTKCEETIWHQAASIVPPSNDQSHNSVAIDDWV